VERARALHRNDEDTQAMEGGEISVDLGTAAAMRGVGMARAWQTIIAMVAVLSYQGFTMSINGVAASWIADSFHLGQSGIAGLYARISVAAIGALILSRQVDRIGRRRVLLWCMTATPLCALGAALSRTLLLFTLFEVLLYAFIGAAVSGSVVMLAEELPVDLRAKGQSYGGLAMGLGSGLCVLLMPLLSGSGDSWRWLLILSASGLLGVPFVSRLVPESQRWQRAVATGSVRRARFHDVFAARYRGRAVPIMVCSLLSSIAVTAGTSWSYYHAVSVVGLSPGHASLMVVVGGGVGLLGYPLGAWFCERLGRVPTVVGFGLFGAIGALSFYWGPPMHFALPAVWLGAAFGWFTGAGNASMVGGYAAATELFPTAIRGTMIGWFSLLSAVGSVSAQAAIALLAEPLGGLSNVVGYLALLAMPSAIIFGLCIEETRGISLDVAARE
jgi:MFS family permease